MRLHRDAKVDLIRTVPLFAGCTDEELKRVAAVADEVDFAEGRRLTKQSSPGRELVVVIEGTADVLQGDEMINQVGPGEFVGEVALVTGQPRTATVLTTSPVHALVIESHAFERLLGEAPEIKAKVERAAWEHLQGQPGTADA